MRTDTETHCHCGAAYNGSDHCPACGCEQYESGDCGASAREQACDTCGDHFCGADTIYSNGHIGRCPEAT